MFENGPAAVGPPGNPPGWAFSTDGVGGTWEVVQPGSNDPPPPQGEKFLRLLPGLTVNNQPLYSLVSQTLGEPVQANTTYELRVKMRNAERFALQMFAVSESVCGPPPVLLASRQYHPNWNDPQCADGPASGGPERAAPHRPAHATSVASGRILPPMVAATQQWILQGLNHAQAGRLQQAEKCYRQVLAFDPNPTTRILLAGLVPPVYLSMQELHEARTRVMNNLRALSAEGIALDVTNQYAVPEFFITYQGLNDRDLQKLRASLYRAPRELMLPARRRRGRISVGFASAHFREHTIGRLNMGLIAQLDPDQFHVTVFTPGAPKGELAEFIRDHADAYIELPNDVNYSRRVIAGQKLDVLLYTDLGMEPVTYTLAQTRLAPVQCATWGHPVTSGIANVDYFISAEALEADGADEHYTEKLVRLPNLAVYYYRPQLGAPASRAALNLPEGATLYGCPQSLYKFHPEFDEILAGILRGDPKGLLVLLKGNHVEWEQRLMQRFGQTMGDVVDRIRWIPRQDRNGYLNLMACLDMSLDPIHFGGGNTSYEALALGVPIVTMPSGLLRGRLTYAMYRQMNLMECVVDSPQKYIETALRLGTDRAYRQEISDRIKSSGEAIFENRAAVEDLQNFFEQVVG